MNILYHNRDRIDVYTWKGLSSSFWTNLSVAIIYRACMDYEDRLVALYYEKDPIKSRNLYSDFKEVKTFFGSDWWYVLTEVDHKSILKRLNEQARDRIKHKQLTRKYQPLWGAFSDE